MDEEPLSSEWFVLKKDTILAQPWRRHLRQPLRKLDVSSVLCQKTMRRN